MSVLRLQRRSLVLLACGAVAVSGAFSAGLVAGGGGTAAASVPTETFTGRRGDVFRVPAVGVRCLVGQEGGSPRLLCNYAPSGRYDVVFFRESLYVYRRGRPDDPVFFGKR